MPELRPIVVAGHACLDIIPQMSHAAPLAPGRLVEVGAAKIAGGGAVSNTGLALHRLGYPVRLVAKTGNDAFGVLLRGVYEAEGRGLGAGLAAVSRETTSYSVVISPPGLDRTFLHAPGCNATFCASDVPDSALIGACWMHFGYPPLMRGMFAESGRELAALLKRAKALGLGTSLDMSLPDPDSEAGRADWPAILANALPHVDVFMPSADEIAWMLGARKDEPAVMARALHKMGVPVVGIKLGAEGLWVSSVRHPIAEAPDWTFATTMQPSFPVRVEGTTGAGDAAIAGFLFGVLSGLSFRDTVASAAAVGALCCERPDAVSGIPDWQTVQNKLSFAWSRHIAPPRQAVFDGE